jgi:hypothetical protein
MRRNRLVPLKDLADVRGGYRAKSSERKNKGQYKLIGGRNIAGPRLRPTKKDCFLVETSGTNFDRCILRPGDILISVLFEERKLYVYKDSDPKAVAGESLAIIRPRSDTFLADYFNTATGRERFLQEAARKTDGRFFKALRITDLREIRIPLLEPAQIQDLAENDLSLVGNELVSLIAKGESSTQEFKSTLRKSLRSGVSDNALEDAALKAIAALCNTDGGRLLIGVKDDGTILGIERDNFSNTDRFSCHLGDLIQRRLDPSPVDSVKLRVVRYSGRSVCIIECVPTDREIWFLPKKQSGVPELYVRVGPSSRALRGTGITDYYRNRFG